MSLDEENEPHMGTDSFCKECDGFTADDVATNDYNSKIIKCQYCGHIKKNGWVPKDSSETEGDYEGY